MKKIIVFFILLVFVFGCKKSVESPRYDKFSVSPKSSVVEVKDSTDEALSLADFKNEEVKLKKSTSKEVTDTRKLVKNGSINYTVNDLKPVEVSVGAKVKEFGGYIVSSSFTFNSATIEAKIPFERFDDFLLVTGRFGKITSKNVNVEDVTMQYFDLENRIKNKRILQARFQSYLSTALRTEDLLKTEVELNKVTEEIESLEGTFKNLSNQISYSTITMSFYVPGNDVQVKVLPSLKKGFEDLGFIILNFLYGLMFFVLYLVIIGVPVIILSGGIYYVSFGKIGLIKKMFKYLSRKK